MEAAQPKVQRGVVLWGNAEAPTPYSNVILFEMNWIHTYMNGHVLSILSYRCFLIATQVCSRNISNNFISSMFVYGVDILNNI